MDIRYPFLLPALLVLSWGGGAAPATAGPRPRAESLYSLDLPTMAERACRLKLSLEPRPSLAGCRVTVSNGGSVPVTPVGAGSFVHFSSAPVATSCGLWDAALTLAPVRLQPVLEMRADLRLTNRETGQTADFALRPGSGLAGPWALSSNGRSPAPIFLADEDDEDDDGETIWFEGCIPAWVLKDPKYKIDPDQDCEICPEDDSSDPDSDALALPEPL